MRQLRAPLHVQEERRGSRARGQSPAPPARRAAQEGRPVHRPGRAACSRLQASATDDAASARLIGSINNRAPGKKDHSGGFESTLLALLCRARPASDGEGDVRWHRDVSACRVLAEKRHAPSSQRLSGSSSGFRQLLGPDCVAHGCQVPCGVRQRVHPGVIPQLAPSHWTDRGQRRIARAPLPSAFIRLSSTRPPPLSRT